MSPRKTRDFTVPESAELLGRSTKSVRRYIGQGMLEGRKIQGKHGPEIRVTGRSLDDLLKRLSKASKPADDPYEILRLYRKASPDVRVLGRKILTSSPREEAPEEKKGILRPFFWKRGGEKS